MGSLLPDQRGIQSRVRGWSRGWTDSFCQRTLQDLDEGRVPLIVKDLGPLHRTELLEGVEQRVGVGEVRRDVRDEEHPLLILRHVALLVAGRGAALCLREGRARTAGALGPALGRGR